MATKNLPLCDCDLDLLAHDERATHAFGCPAGRRQQDDHREYEAEALAEHRRNG